MALSVLKHIHQWISDNLYSAYASVEIFNKLEQAYLEHFAVVADQVSVNSSDQLHISGIQSPDDIDAIYRDKNGNAI